MCSRVKTIEINFYLDPENTIFSTSRILASARKKHEERRIKNHSPTSGIFPHSYYKTQNSTNSRNKKIDAGSAFDNYYSKL